MFWIVFTKQVQVLRPIMPKYLIRRKAWKISRLVVLKVVDEP